MAAATEECSGVFVCDLPSGLSDYDLRKVFQHYGDIGSLEQVHDFSEEAVFVEYALPESAEEAQSMLNHASVREKTCRCLLASSLDTIRNTMDTGQRLVVENLDISMESRGLLDVCSLFGRVLDCKVELDEEDRSRRYGFAHFAEEAEAAKARKFMDGSQLGDSVVEVRPFESKDAALFTGCLYANRGQEKEKGTAEPAKAKGEAAPSDGQQAFASLHTHHLEVIAEVPEKLERLKTLTQLYNPNQEQQMIVIASSSNLQAIGKLMGEVFEEGDFETVSLSTSTEDRKEAIDAFETGNTFALLLASEIATRKDFEMNKKATVLVNFDFPNTFQAYLQRISKRADENTRTHGFFSPTIDKQLAVEVMSAMEDAGHEIPPALVELL